MRVKKYRAIFGDDVTADPIMLSITADVDVGLGEELDQLNITHQCCRTKMLTQVMYSEYY